MRDRINRERENSTHESFNKEKAWVAIEKELPKKRRRKVILFWLIGIGLILVPTMEHIANKTRNTKEISARNNHIEHIPADDQIASLIKPTTIVETPVQNPKTNNRIRIQNSKSPNSVAKNRKTTEYQPIKASNQKVTSITTSLVNNGLNLAAPRTPNLSSHPHSTHSDFEHSTESNIHHKEELDNTNLKNELSQYSRPSDARHSSDLEFLLLPKFEMRSTQYSPFKVNIPGNSKDSNILPHMENRSIQLTLDFGPHIFSRMFQNVPPEFLQVSRKRSLLEQEELSWKFNLMLRIPFKNSKISLLTGLQFMRYDDVLRSQFNHSVEEQFFSDRAEFYQFSDGSRRFTSGFLTRTTITTTNLQLYNQTSFYNLVLGSSYSLTSAGGWSFVANGGVVVNLLNTRQGHFLTNENLLSEVGENSGLRFGYSGFVLGLQLEYEFLNFGTVNISPSYIRNIYKSDINAEYRGFGLSFGFGYRL